MTALSVDARKAAAPAASASRETRPVWGGVAVDHITAATASSMPERSSGMPPE